MVAVMKTGFPTELISASDRVLCLFAAAFHGQNDVRNLHQIGCENVVLVDIDMKKLTETAILFDYPYICVDVLKHIRNGGSFGKYDVIISDHWTGEMEEMMDANIDRLKTMALKFLIYTTTRTDQPGEYYLRSNHKGGVYWRVISCK